MADIIANQEFDLAVLADVTTAATGILTGAVVDLWQNDYVPVPGTVIGDLTIATYDGYAQKVVTWLAPSVSDDGQVELVGTVPEWRPTGSVTPNSIYGVALRDAAFNLLAAVRLDAPPAPMGSTLDSLITTLRVRIPAGGKLEIVS